MLSQPLTRVLVCSVDVVRYLVQQFPGTIHLQDKKQNTWLHVAARRGNVETLKVAKALSPEVIKDGWLTRNKVPWLGLRCISL